MEQLTTPIVGRDEELGSIERFVGESGPGTLLIEGEAGIGKSTLWSFALEVATSRAARILSWRASTAERGLAFAVLTGLFDAQELEDLLPAIAEPRRHALEVALAR